MTREPRNGLPPRIFPGSIETAGSRPGPPSLAGHHPYGERYRGRRQQNAVPNARSTRTARATITRNRPLAMQARAGPNEGSKRPSRVPEDLRGPTYPRQSADPDRRDYVHLSGLESTPSCCIIPRSSRTAHTTPRANHGWSGNLAPRAPFHLAPKTGPLVGETDGWSGL
jgi:hypothetical protein